MDRLLLILFLMGCSKATVDPAIQPYFDRFGTSIGRSPAGVGASFDDTQADLEGGRCEGGDVYIDRKSWSLMSDSGKEQLVFHELGHCVLGAMHNQHKRGDGCPVSIMYPAVFGDLKCYRDNAFYYYEELKSQ